MKRTLMKCVFSIALIAAIVVGFGLVSTPAQAFNCPSGFGPCTFLEIRTHNEGGCLISCCVYSCPWGEEEGPCYFS